MATPVPNIIALPMPCNALRAIKSGVDVVIATRKEKIVKEMIPSINIFLRPYISAILPIGSKKTAEASRQELTTQLKEMASIENSALMAGRAILIDDPMNGVRKEVITAITKITFLLELFSV
jgi:hypothetical protein